MLIERGEILKRTGLWVLMVSLQLTIIAPDCGAVDRLSLVSYGARAIDRIYEEDILYAPVLKKHTERYYRPLVFLKSSGGFVDPYTMALSQQRNLLNEIRTYSGQEIIFLGKCSGYEDFVLVDAKAGAGAKPGPKAKAGSKPKKGLKPKTETARSLILSGKSWDLYDMGFSQQHVVIGNSILDRWKGYSRKTADYYDRIAGDISGLDPLVRKSCQKPSFHFITTKNGLIGSYRIYLKTLEGDVFSENRYFSATDPLKTEILPLDYKKARDSELIYLSDIDGNGTDNFALLMKYWDKGIYFSQILVYEFKSPGWALVLKTVPFACHKQVGYEPMIE